MRFQVGCLARFAQMYMFTTITFNTWPVVVFSHVVIQLIGAWVAKAIVKLKQDVFYSFLGTSTA